MRKYKLKELRDLVRLGVAEDYTNKPSEYIYTLRRLEKVGYSAGVYGINGGLVEDTECRRRPPQWWKASKTSSKSA